MTLITYHPNLSQLTPYFGWQFHLVLIDDIMMHNKLLNVACINIQNTPTRVFTIGGDISSNPKEIILVIPGKEWFCIICYSHISYQRDFMANEWKILRW